MITSSNEDGTEPENSEQQIRKEGEGEERRRGERRERGGEEKARWGRRSGATPHPKLKP